MNLDQEWADSNAIDKLVGITGATIHDCVVGVRRSRTIDQLTAAVTVDLTGPHLPTAAPRTVDGTGYDIAVRIILGDTPLPIVLPWTVGNANIGVDLVGHIEPGTGRALSELLSSSDYDGDSDADS